MSFFVNYLLSFFLVLIVRWAILGLAKLNLGSTYLQIEGKIKIL